VALRNPQEVSLLLQAWCNGDRDALDRLVPIIYAELHRMARKYMVRERPDHTLQTTALVNEAYLRLISANKVAWQSRAHFFAISANLMRQILVDMARTRDAQKRGRDFCEVSLKDGSIISARPDANLIELDSALTALAELDPRKASVVELKFFGGLEHREIAEVLKVHVNTVQRDWDLAKTWLYREMKHASRRV
jgi:RNA polymerase sigma factor (TIGR02999 family)